VLLIFIGAIVKFWAWIAAVLGGLMVFGLLLWLAFYAARRVDAREHARIAIVARADQQHGWTLAGRASVSVCRAFTPICCSASGTMLGARTRLPRAAPRVVLACFAGRGICWTRSRLVSL
jgi:hypothetical protein